MGGEEVKGASWVTGRGLSAPMRRLPMGASDLSPRARIWLMSGVWPDPNTSLLSDDHVVEGMESAKTFPKPQPVRYRNRG